MHYQNQDIYLASKHQKEQAIAPVFKQALNASIVPLNYDTDQFGTFTGEIPRQHPPLTTCILKAKTCALEANVPLVIASEGSFGPHPHIPIIPFAREIMVFVDMTKNLIIHETLETFNTNYASLNIKHGDNIDTFLSQVKFPSHGLCLQTGEPLTIIAKGITSRESLLLALNQGFQQTDELLITTDMRAMMNPSRMQTIQELASKLAARISCYCPRCDYPGYGQIGVDGYLPCAQCALPAKSYAREVFACRQCNFQESKPRRDGLIAIEPQYCNHCNP
jgi:hypothetical protein